MAGSWGVCARIIHEVRHEGPQVEANATKRTELTSPDKLQAKTRSMIDGRPVVDDTRRTEHEYNFVSWKVVFREGLPSNPGRLVACKESPRPGQLIV